jgi:4-amino-4-deoxy-L-arabinose transferase-like glycosyltransferase
MCLTVLVYLATGLLVRMRLAAATPATYAAFGAVLGLAYLTKSAMFPLSFVYLALASALTPRHLAWRRIGLAAGAFAIVAAPWITAVSLAKHRLTFGDTGKLAYVWFANGATDRELHWWREFPDDHRPVHPTRKIHDRPAIYEFGSDGVGGTYPVWYDPSYWHEGETPRFDLRGQLRVLHWSADEIWRMVVDDSDFVLLSAFILLAVGMTGWRVMTREAVAHAELMLPAVAAVGMYSLVLFSPRYVAVFLLLFWIGLFASVRLPRTTAANRLAWAAVIGVLTVATLRILPLTHAMFNEIRAQRAPDAHRSFIVAEDLRRLGAAPGDKVARIGYGPPAYWARLARVHITAEMFGEEPDFTLVPDIDQAVVDGELRPEIVDAFARTGVRFLIAWKVPANVARHGWTELGGRSRWFAYPVTPR